MWWVVMVLLNVVCGYDVDNGLHCCEGVVMNCVVVNIFGIRVFLQ